MGSSWPACNTRQSLPGRQQIARLKFSRVGCQKNEVTKKFSTLFVFDKSLHRAQKCLWLSEPNEDFHHETDALSGVKFSDFWDFGGIMSWPQET